MALVTLTNSDFKNAINAKFLTRNGNEMKSCNDWNKFLTEISVFRKKTILNISVKLIGTFFVSLRT